MKTAHLRVQLVLPLIITFRDISILLQIRCLHLKAAVDCICQTRLHWTVAKDKWMEIWILVDSESDEFPSLEFECLFLLALKQVYGSVTVSCLVMSILNEGVVTLSGHKYTISVMQVSKLC